MGRWDNQSSIGFSRKYIRTFFNKQVLPDLESKLTVSSTRCQYLCRMLIKCQATALIPRNAHQGELRRPAALRKNTRAGAFSTCCRTWNRTKIRSFKGCCPTFRRSGNVLPQDTQLQRLLSILPSERRQKAPLTFRRSGKYHTLCVCHQ